jgi:hypothetical protein
VKVEAWDTKGQFVKFVYLKIWTIMGTPFSDISLYTPIPHATDSPEYREETSPQNFVSDLYVQKMYGYKPPKATRVSIQPGFYGQWSHPWKHGSVISIASYFNYEDYSILEKKGKYRYILDLIQSSMLQLCEEYHWEKSVFEKAYLEIIETDFKFRITYPSKLSQNKKKSAKISIEKTETITTVYSELEVNGTVSKIKLFDKKNGWWYDCAYKLCPFNKWIDNNKFGIHYEKGIIDIWYSIEKDQVELFEKSNPVAVINFKNYFPF